MFEFNFQCRTFILVCNQPPRSTQPGHPFMGRHNECQPKGGDACGWGVKAGWFVCGWQVKLCDLLVTHGTYLSALETWHNEALYKFTFIYIETVYIFLKNTLSSIVVVTCLHVVLPVLVQM